MAIKKITEVDLAPEEMGEVLPNIYIEHEGVLYRASSSQIAKIIGSGLDFEKIKDAVESGLGSDVDFDEDEQQLFLLDSEGNRIGLGTRIVAGITGLQMRTEEDDNNTQYLIISDVNGVELCRTEFTVSGSGSSTAYTCRLINGMSSTNMSIPSGQGCALSYEFYEYYGTERTTVDATAQYYVKSGTGDYELVKTENINQGTHTVSAAEYLSTGTNYFKIQVTGGESGIIKTLTFTVNVVDVGLSSAFSDTTAYTSTISFLYRVTGKNLKKTMHFLIDGEIYDEVDIGTSHNVQLTESINMAKYGHGDHVLVCYFITSDGTKSPELKYDIMFDTGESTPIISSTFDTEEVTYGETVTVDYVVFTHGNDYTSQVSLGIYSLDADNEKVYFSSTVLENVVNQVVQKWNISNYPDNGDIYLEIVAGSSSKTFKLTVNPIGGDRDLSDVTTRLIAAFSASGRSNNDSSRGSFSAKYTSKDNIDTNIKGTLSGFNYRSNGWVSDDDGFPVLRVSGEASVSIDLPFMASSWIDGSGKKVQLAGTPTAAGRTFEIAFRTKKVTDESKEIITIWDDASGVGVRIFPSRAYLLSDAMSITEDKDGNVLNKNVIPYVPYSSKNGKVRLSFVIEQNGYFQEDDGTGKQLIRIYVNGQLASAVPYSADTFNSNTAKPYISADSCILDVYTMRFYDYALDDAGILKNFIADLPSISEKVEIHDQNAIVDDNDDIDFFLAIHQYTCMVLTGTLSRYKGDKTKIGVRLYKPDGSYDDGYYIDLEFMEQLDGKYGNVNNVQGTSSQYYLKKNYKITFYKLVDGVWKKVKITIIPGRIPVDTICIKADYMSPDSANTGNSNFWQTLLEEKTPAQEEDSRVQTSIMGYPILVFQCDVDGETPSFIGRYCLNNDKSNAEVFGLKCEGDNGSDTRRQKWEYLDNSEDICNWKTDKLFALRQDKDGNTYPAWKDALESTYPDQGDLDDEGIEADLSRMQIHYSWVVQRANFLDASKNPGTGGEYAGVVYDTEYDLKFAIFKAEFPKHFNQHHMTHYFIANETPLMVDNFSKNFFATLYEASKHHIVDLEGSEVNVMSLIAKDGSGTVDISNIDWINSTFDPIYATIYDTDSCLGSDNNGYDQFPYYAEMWDTYNGKQIVNGSENLLWRLWYAAFFEEYRSLYRHFRNVSKTLSPELYKKAMIDDVTKKWPIVAVNKDQKFKYIDAYEGGYYSYETNSWLYTSAYMYLVKSTMESYHADFIDKRFAMLDSKNLEDSYMQDNFNLRVNRGVCTPEDLAFEVSPCQALYCYTEWGNSGSYIGGKCLEGDTIEMKPSNSGNWFDIVLAIYGASKYKSLGDLSVLYPSKLQNLSLCVNLVELILGSDDPDYSNSLLTSISDVSYLTMLKILNICNLVALSGTVDLSNCDLIEEVYATGSAISAVVLPEGGYLKILHLPSGITALNIMDHSGMKDFQMESYNNLLRLRVENTPNVHTDKILMARGANLARIRLVGVDWTLENEEVLRLIVDDSMKGKAIDATGTAVDNTEIYPIITGAVTIDEIQGSLYDKLRSVYPDLTINYTKKYHKVKFVDYDGSDWNDQKVYDNESAATPTSPQRSPDVQFIWSFRGWDLSYSKVTSDMVITAQYSSALQQYDIEFYLTEGGEKQAEVLGVQYGVEYEYPEDEPTAEGKIFAGWKDKNGYFYAYSQQMPNQSAELDENGNPEVIKLYAVFQNVEMPSTSKSLEEMTEGEKLFIAIAIQEGSAEGCTVTYYPDTNEYIVQDNTTLASVSVAAGDSAPFTLFTGEILDRQILDFNHDYMDLEETQAVGITYAFKELMKDTRAMNPSYKHWFHYKIGNDEAYQNDLLDHSSATDALLKGTHTVTEEEAASGYCDIVAISQTYLASIQVLHADGTTTTWHMDKNGYWADADMESRSGQAWYKSDINEDVDNQFYKLAKMISSRDSEKQWLSSQLLQGDITGEKVTFSDFGGLVIDATGEDTYNTASVASDGTGIARVRFYSDYSNDWNNFTEVTMGVAISVPVVVGDTVIVNAYGYSRNALGWDNSAMQKWANADFLRLMPIAVRNTLVPVCKKSSVGNRSMTIQKGMYTAWLLSNAELRGWTTTHPYMDEGTPYPIFTNDASRVKHLANGEGAAYTWWERSPGRGYSCCFMCVNTGGYPYNGLGWAHGRFGVALGFCSGRKPSAI